MLMGSTGLMRESILRVYTLFSRMKFISQGSLLLFLSFGVCLLMLTCGCTGESGDATTPSTVVAEETPVAVNPSVPMTLAAVPATPPGWKADGIISPGEYASSVSSDDGLFTLHWQTTDELVVFGIEGQAQGWLSLGMNPTERMKDADIILGARKEPAMVLYDMYSTGVYGPHPPDNTLGGTDNLLERAGMYQDGVITLECSRLLVTGDSYDTVLIPGEEVSILWASATSPDYKDKHDRKATSTIIL